jgi:hypothetical protein
MNKSVSDLLNKVASPAQEAGSGNEPNNQNQQPAAGGEQPAATQPGGEGAQQQQQVPGGGQQPDANGAGGGSQNIENQQPTIDNSIVMKYLSEQHKVSGFESVDELIAKVNQPAHQYANEEIAAIDKYVKETGRNAQDYYKLGQDYNSIDKIDRVKQHYRDKFPTMTDEMIEATLKLDLTPLESTEDHEYSDLEISERNRQILLRDANIEMIDEEARSAFNERKKHYSQPTDSKAQREADLKAWQEGISSAAQNFDLGIEGYNYQKSDTLPQRYATIETALSQFVGEGGGFDYKRFMQTVEAGLEMQNILSVIAKGGNASGQEQVLDEMKNASNNTPLVPDNSAPDPIKNNADTVSRLLKAHKK